MDDFFTKLNSADDFFSEGKTMEAPTETHKRKLAESIPLPQSKKPRTMDAANAPSMEPPEGRPRRLQISPAWTFGRTLAIESWTPISEMKTSGSASNVTSQVAAAVAPEPKIALDTSTSNYNAMEKATVPSEIGILTKKATGGISKATSQVTSAGAAEPKPTDISPFKATARAYKRYMNEQRQRIAEQRFIRKQQKKLQCQGQYQSTRLASCAESSIDTVSSNKVTEKSIHVQATTSRAGRLISR
jgi:hypothetical protein